MSFLAPLFLLGGLAVALPIILHLIRRTTRIKIPFSSLIFLKPTPPRVTRRSRLENIFLLILRCSVLALLAMGFARPFLSKPAAAPASEQKGAQWVLMLDVSASMQREGLWKQAVDQAEVWLAKTGPLDQLAILAFGASVQTVLGFEEWRVIPLAERVPAAAQRLRALSPTWSNTRLGPAFWDALETMADVQAEDGWQGSRQIILISDLQEGARLDGLQGLQWPEDITVQLDPVVSRQPANAGVTLLPDLSDTGQVSATNLVRVLVVNAADADREQFQIQWMSAQGVPLGEGAVKAYVPPGQKRVIGVPMPTATNDVSHLALVGDDHPFDNEAYYAPVRQQVQTLLLVGGDTGPEPQGLRYYLERAFQETSRRKTVVVTPPADRPLLAEEWEPARLLIATGPPQESSMRLLRAFLESGRRALVVLREPGDGGMIFDLFNAPRNPAIEAAVSQYAMFGEIDFTHPLFQPFTDPRYSDFTKIHFWHYRQLDLEGLPEPAIVARFDNGDPALLEWSVGRGTLDVLTSSWRPGDSQLALSSKFVPLLHSLLDLSGDSVSDQTLFFVGDAIPVPGGSHGDVATIVNPAGTATNMVAGSTYLETTRPGLYTVTLPGKTTKLAVNIAAEESRTAPMLPEDLEKLGLPLAAQSTLDAARAAAALEHLRASELESRQKLWRLLILAAVVVLLTETWVAGRLSRAVAQ